MSDSAAKENAHSLISDCEIKSSHSDSDSSSDSHSEGDQSPSASEERYRK